MISPRADAIQRGGSSRIFRNLREPMWFSGGGGSGRIFFRDLQLRNLIFNRHLVIFVGGDTHFF